MCSVSVRLFYIIILCINIHVHTMSYHTVRAYLVYWKEEDSVSVTHRDDMVEQVPEPAVGDMVKIKSQHQIC